MKCPVFGKELEEETIFWLNYNFVAGLEKQIFF